MDILKVVLTIVFFIGILFLLQKKFSPAITLTVIGFIGILIGVAINGYDLLGDSSTGNIFFDLFEYFRASAVVSTISSMGLRIMSILTYVAFMDNINATKMFALLVSKPVMKIKNKYALAGGVFVLTAILILAIPNGTGRMAILIGTVYPVMLACGVTNATAATAIFAGAMFSWGPANPKVPTAAAYMGIDVNIAQYFLQIEWLWDILAIGLGMLAFVLTSRYFDKKEDAKCDNSAYASITVESLGVPKWYAILPVIPVVLIIIFGGVISALPTLEIATIEFMSFICVLIFLTLISKNKKEMWAKGNILYTGIGDALGRIVGIIIGATVFGTGISALGGIDVIMTLITNLGSDNLILFVFMAGMITVLIATVAANDYVANSIMGPIFTKFAAISGLNPNGFLLVGVNSANIGLAFTPATAHVALVSEGSGVSINTIIKRAIIPLIVSIIVFFVGAIISVRL